MEDPYEGDRQMSVFDHKVWSLHQRVLMQFNCYTIFKTIPVHVPTGWEEYILWFVPADHTYTYEVVKFLETELESERREHTETYPGCEVHVQVVTYTGLMPYLEEAAFRKIVEQCMKEFHQRLDKEKRHYEKRKEEEDG